MFKVFSHLILLIPMALLPAVATASDLCQQQNINQLSSTYPKIKALIERHQAEQEKLERKLEIMSGKSEAALDEDMQTEKQLSELDSVLTKEFKQMAQRQYAEFWELCSEVTE